MSDSVETGHTQLDSLEGVFCLTILESIASDGYNNLLGSHRQYCLYLYLLVWVIWKRLISRMTNDLVADQSDAIGFVSPLPFQNQMTPADGSLLYIYNATFGKRV